MAFETCEKLRDLKQDLSQKDVLRKKKLTTGKSFHKYYDILQTIPTGSSCKIDQIDVSTTFL